jgi:hypothetical protein
MLLDRRQALLVRRLMGVMARKEQLSLRRGPFGIGVDQDRNALEWQILSAREDYLRHVLLGSYGEEYVRYSRSRVPALRAKLRSL